MSSSKELKRSTKKLLRNTFRIKQLALIEPNIHLTKAYLEKSVQYAISAQLLVENNHLEESITLFYYSMYYSATALLVRCGIKSQNHAATIVLLTELFNIDAVSFIRAKKERIEKQYFVDFSIAREEVISFRTMSEHFSQDLFTFIETLHEEDIARFREQLNGVLLPKN